MFIRHLIGIGVRRCGCQFMEVPCKSAMIRFVIVVESAVRIEFTCI